MFAEIEISTTQKLELFIQGLGIPTIGAASAKTLALELGSLSNLTKQNIMKPDLVKKLGQVKHNNLVEFLDTELYREIISLPLQLKSPVSVPKTTNKGCVCITGKLNDFPNRKAAEEYLLQLGWDSKSSVTKDVTVLICEDDSKKSSSSYKKAVQKGLPILTITQLLQSN